MTGRERIEAVIRREKPDRVPVAPLINEHAAKVLGVPLGDCFHQPKLAVSAEQVESYCRRLIEGVGADGGFVLANACALPHDAKIENVRVLLRAAEKYGVY